MNRREYLGGAIAAGGFWTMHGAFAANAIAVTPVSFLGVRGKSLTCSHTKARIATSDQ